MKLIRHEVLSGEMTFADVARDQEFTLETTDWTGEIFHAPPVDVWKHCYTSSNGNARTCVEFVHALPPDGTESEVWIFDAADITPGEFDETIKLEKMRN